MWGKDSGLCYQICMPWACSWSRSHHMVQRKDRLGILETSFLVLLLQSDACTSYVDSGTMS